MRESVCIHGRLIIVVMSFEVLFVVFGKMHNRQEEPERDWPVSFGLCPVAYTVRQAWGNYKKDLGWLHELR